MIVRTSPLRLVLGLSLLTLVGCGSTGGPGHGGDGGLDGGLDAAVDAGDGGGTPSCGDGVKSGSEACDDGNTANGDGCSATCTVETNYACPTPGMACVLIVVCGDAKIEGGETCDDQNTVGGDGCSADCQLEAGWTCPVVGAACVAKECGDGIVAGFEACDDGNAATPGCDASCQLEWGYTCPPTGGACTATVCGDGLVQGLEQCDDGGVRPFDGCSPDCLWEPNCSGGVCVAVCGDGVILPGAGAEECDDGNLTDGDGCSSTCTKEDGFTCVLQPEPAPTEIHLPLLMRDFKGIEWYTPAQNGHPDFNDPNDGNDVISYGLVQSTLDAQGRPALVADAPASDTTGMPKTVAGFMQWYRDDATVNMVEYRELVLTQGGMDYLFDSAPTGFYPIDDGGWVAAGQEQMRTADATVNDGLDHNFNFTTETHFWFEYDGSERLTFSGDDDLWVFVDGVLCLDVGGLHPARSGVMDLSDPTDGGNATAQQEAVVTACKAHLDALPGGSIVEMVIFHAERHTNASNFQLTLRSFLKQRSSCTYTCGDGIVTRFEACDDGAANGTGTGYGGCDATCNFEPYCGDGHVDAAFGEICDDGINLGGDASACSPGCKSLGAACGDGVLQPSNGEQCDDGNTANGDGCSATCQLEIS